MKQKIDQWLSETKGGKFTFLFVLSVILDSLVAWLVGWEMLPMMLIGSFFASLYFTYKK